MDSALLIVGDISDSIFGRASQKSVTRLIKLVGGSPFLLLALFLCSLHVSYTCILCAIKIVSLIT